jgi:hypothetical protein
VSGGVVVEYNVQKAVGGQMKETVGCLCQVSGGEVVEYYVQKAVGGQLVGEGDHQIRGRRQSADCVRRRGC